MKVALQAPVMARAAAILAPSLIGRVAVLPTFRHFASAADSGVITVADDAQYAAELKGHAGLAVVDFTATWCGPCKSIAPVFDRLAAAHPNVKFLKVDIDNQDVQDTVMSAQVSAVPTFNFIKNGGVAFQIRGADSATLEAKVAELSK